MDPSSEGDVNVLYPILHSISNKKDERDSQNLIDLNSTVFTGEGWLILNRFHLAPGSIRNLSCERVGFHRHPIDCTKFYHCPEFKSNESGPYTGFMHKCPNGLVFDERQVSCVWPSMSDPCKGSLEVLPSERFLCSVPGFHVDPVNCRWFYYCSYLGSGRLEAFEFSCPSEILGFDEERMLCNWKWTVPGCFNKSLDSNINSKVSDNESLKLQSLTRKSSDATNQTESGTAIGGRYLRLSTVKSPEYYSDHSFDLNTKNNEMRNTSENYKPFRGKITKVERRKHHLPTDKNVKYNNFQIELHRDERKQHSEPVSISDKTILTFKCDNLPAKSGTDCSKSVLQENGYQQIPHLRNLSDRVTYVKINENNIARRFIRLEEKNQNNEFSYKAINPLAYRLKMEKDANKTARIQQHAELNQENSSSIDANIEKTRTERNFYPHGVLLSILNVNKIQSQILVEVDSMLNNVMKGRKINLGMLKMINVSMDITPGKNSSEPDEVMEMIRTVENVIDTSGVVKEFTSHGRNLNDGMNTTKDPIRKELERENVTIHLDYTNVHKVSNNAVYISKKHLINNKIQITENQLNPANRLFGRKRLIPKYKYSSIKEQLLRQQGLRNVAQFKNTTKAIGSLKLLGDLHRNSVTLKIGHHRETFEKRAKGQNVQFGEHEQHKEGGSQIVSRLFSDHSGFKSYLVTNNYDAELNTPIVENKTFDSFPRDINGDQRDTLLLGTKPLQQDPIYNEHKKGKMKRVKVLIRKTMNKIDSPVMHEEEKQKLQNIRLNTLRNKYIAIKGNVELQIRFQDQVWNVPFVSEQKLTPALCIRAGLFQHPNDCKMFYECFWDEWLQKFTLHVFSCPIRLVYDGSIRGCIRPNYDSLCSSKPKL